MKTLNIKYILFATLISLITLSCQESVDINADDGNMYQTTNDIGAAIISQDGKYKTATVSFRDESNYDLFVEITKPMSGVTEGSITLNESYLEAFNSENDTEYILLPSSNYTLAGNGAIQIEKNAKKSASMQIALNSSTELDPTITYAIPLKFTTNSSDVVLKDGNDKFLLLVKDYTAYPVPGNVNDIKIISCIEVNDCNPLNNLSYTLASTGQPLFDMVILFSSNIVYSEELGKPLIEHNTQMTNVLSNREKYIKPLQDRGIKVMLSLLGHRQRAGVANMASATIKMYTQEIKNTLDVYELDGVMFDDEYSEYYPIYPGFVSPSSTAAANLIYGTKQAIGDKLVFTYLWNELRSLPAVDGVEPGQYVDYALSNYFEEPATSEEYPGITNRQKAPWSQEFSLGYFYNDFSWYFSYERIIQGGYGAHMIFALDPNRGNFASKQLPELKKMTSILCSDELVYDGVVYPADHK